jgi:cobalt-zinc-cadmium efflux system outer membrane protein
MLVGCTTIPQEAGFSDVERSVADRGIKRVHWNQGTPSDEAVALAVQEMLAEELTADQAVQIALLNNRNLQATYEDLSVAQADLVQAGLLKNPVFDFDFRFYEGSGGPQIEGSIVQEFIDILQIPLRKRVAESRFEAAKLRVAGAILDLAAQTRTGFYRLQADQQLLEMRRTVLEASEASYKIAQRLRESGNIT